MSEKPFVHHESIGSAAWAQVDIVEGYKVSVTFGDKLPLPTTSARALAALINVACDIIESRRRST